MARPNVSIALVNGGLGLTPPSNFGTSVVLVASPAAPTAGYGTAFLVRNQAEVAAAFADGANVAVVTAFAKGFYAEAPEGTKCYVLAMARTTTLATLFAQANVDKPLLAAAGEARLVAAIKFPDGGVYTPTVTDGMDADVWAAVTAAETAAADWLSKRKPFRYFIQPYAPVLASLKDHVAADDRNGHIVIGEIAASAAAATLLALGRAAKIGSQENIGKVKLGSLAIADADAVTIDDTAVDLITSAQLNTLDSKRYITFERNQVESGFVFTDDNSLTAPDDDYNNLRHGRVIDNAVRVAHATYYKELKDDVDVDEDGRLSAVAERNLETVITTAIDRDMRNQLTTRRDGTSDVTVLVNPNVDQFGALYAANGISSPNLNILQTNTIYVFLQLRPKGCLKYINVYVGFVA